MKKKIDLSEIYNRYAFVGKFSEWRESFGFIKHLNKNEAHLFTLLKFHNGYLDKQTLAKIEKMYCFFSIGSRPEFKPKPGDAPYCAYDWYLFENKDFEIDINQYENLRENYLNNINSPLLIKLLNANWYKDIWNNGKIRVPIIDRQLIKISINRMQQLSEQKEEQLIYNALSTAPYAIKEAEVINYSLQSKNQFADKKSIRTENNHIDLLETYLKKFDFQEAEKVYKENVSKIDSNTYMLLKAKYLSIQKEKQLIELEKKKITSLKYIEDLLKKFHFDEANEHYLTNEQILDNNSYQILITKYRNLFEENKKKEEMFNRLITSIDTNGIIKTNIIFNNQTLISKIEYDKLCNTKINKWLINELKYNPNTEQLNALVAFEKHVLLHARAGSGKTSTVVAKTYFLIKHEHFSPDQVMLLAFNKKAADEITIRIRKKIGLLDFNNAKTFHSLAYQLVQPKQNLLFDEIGRLKQSKFIQRLVKDAMNPVFKEKMYKLFRSEMSEMQDIGEFLSKEDYLVYRRNMRHLTLGGDSVKSLGEKYIGDFLFEHDIAHAYEKLWYWGNDGNYHPDFTVFANAKNSNIVIEHWGIDENDSLKKVPEEWTITWDEYKKEIIKKREHWHQYNLKNPNDQVILLETSIVDLRHGRDSFEKILKIKMEEVGVSIIKLNNDILFNKIEIVSKSKLTQMFQQFIQKAKKNRLSPEEMKIRIDSLNKNKENIYLFSLMANTIYTKYIEELKKTNSIDFDDLMELSISKIKETSGDCSVRTLDDRTVKLTELKWLMIDEYQDFSSLFYEMIKTIKKYNSDLMLFCVGDDWQAINSFAGSNKVYFNNFEEYFISERKYLLTNYRSSKNVVHFSNAFMRGKGREAICHKNSEGNIYKCYTNKVFIEQRLERKESENYKKDAKFWTLKEIKGEMRNIDQGMVIGRILKACHSIITKEINVGKTIGILSRTNSLSLYCDLFEFKDKLKETCKGYSVYELFDQKVQVETVHGFKGLESDIIILLNVNQGKYPLIHPDQQYFEIFGDNAKDLIQEETNLFYVAMTRAKDDLYFFTEQGKESDFIKNIVLNEYQIN